MDNSRALVASCVGAVIGGMAGYLLFTEHGRTLRRQIEPALEDLRGSSAVSAAPCRRPPAWRTKAGSC